MKNNLDDGEQRKGMAVMAPEKDTTKGADENLELALTAPVPAGGLSFEVYGEIDRIIDQYSRERGQLIRILKESQDVLGYLPEEVQAYIAGKLDLPVSEVNGVVTFYSLFHAEPRGKYGINVCMGTACYVQGAQGLLDDFRQRLALKGGDTTNDGLFTVKSTRCIGACGLAPVVTVNNDVHGKLGRKQVASLIRKYKRQGEVKAVDQKPGRPAADQEQTSPGH